MQPTAGREPLPDMTPADGSILVLTAGDARVVVRPGDGGRIGSFTVGGHELLVTSGRDAIHRGSFPMAPFAGRVRDARFDYDGRTHRLRPTMPPHAIHGVVFDRAWEVRDDCTLEVELGDGWPFAGRVVQRFALEPDRLQVTLELHADEAMPGALGWHPWFRRRVDDSPPARLQLDAAHMLQRDADGVASRTLVPPSEGPWDDTFTGLRRPPVVEWPGILSLELTSSAAFWVVFDEEPHAVCVEPQTEPPDELNHQPTVVQPGAPLVATMAWRWWRPETDDRPPGGA